MKRRAFINGAVSAFTAGLAGCGGRRERRDTTKSEKGDDDPESGYCEVEIEIDASEIPDRDDWEVAEICVYATEDESKGDLLACQEGFPLENETETYENIHSLPAGEEYILEYRLDDQRTPETTDAVYDVKVSTEGCGATLAEVSSALE
jgi:hypothetical protein